MKPTEILENEHRVIEQVLACLIRINDGSGKGKLNAESPGRRSSSSRRLPISVTMARRKSICFP